MGYNINNFDLPYIETRLRKNGLPRTIGRCNQKPIFSRKITNRFRNTVRGRVVVDVYDLVKEGETGYICRFDLPDEIVKRINIVLEEKERSVQMRKQASEFISEHASLEVSAKGFLNALDFCNKD